MALGTPQQIAMAKLIDRGNVGTREVMDQLVCRNERRTTGMAGRPNERYRLAMGAHLNSVDDRAFKDAGIRQPVEDSVTH
jgi:hypothetical protein